MVHVGLAMNFSPGVIKLAQSSGVPIIPVRFEHSSSWRLNSWDRFHIPKPFSKITVHVGDAIDVPAKLDDEEFEQYRQKVQSALLEKPSEKANI